MGTDDHQTASPSEQHLTLHVSNQSFADDPVEITVAIDGDEVVHDRFFVEGQHTWITYELAFTAGTHEVVITSDTGARQNATLDLPPDGERWAVVNYWYDEPDAERPGTDPAQRSISFQIADEPILFD